VFDETAFRTSVRPTFFGWRSKHDDTPADFIKHFAERDCCRNTRRADDVMSARVTDAWQRIILSKKGNRRAWSVARLLREERGIVPRDTEFYRKTFRR